MDKIVQIIACKCGSTKFKAQITLELQGVPVQIKKDGSMSYDDTKAEYCEGWDVSEQSEIACAKCGHLYDLDRTGDYNKKDMDIYTLTDKEVKK